MIMNRIADVFFILSIILIFLIFRTTDFIVVLNLMPFISQDLYIFLGFECLKINIIAFFLFIGAIGKSAQIGLHT
jgi:NADH:ubiquinone oxidoreductase subunit 5 (subunit L)/multisubunit Na+/H+ antiporter MnhA subunit